MEMVHLLLQVLPSLLTTTARLFFIEVLLKLVTQFVNGHARLLIHGNIDNIFSTDSSECWVAVSGETSRTINDLNLPADLVHE